MPKQIETGQRKLTLPGIEHVKHFLAAAGGKGGVGKTTVCSNRSPSK